ELRQILGIRVAANKYAIGSVFTKNLVQLAAQILDERLIHGDGLYRSPKICEFRSDENADFVFRSTASAHLFRFFIRLVNPIGKACASRVAARYMRPVNAEWNHDSLGHMVGEESSQLAEVRGLRPAAYSGIRRGGFRQRFQCPIIEIHP